MPPHTDTFTTPLDAAVCTELFTYIVVVFFLVRFSLEELGPEARRLGYVPPSSLLYLACILLWPVTMGIFATLCILGLLHAGLEKTRTLAAQGLEACRRRTTSCFLKRPRAVDFEMGSLVPCHLEGVVWEYSGTNCEGSQAEMVLREAVATLKAECGLTPEVRGRGSHSRSLAPLR